MFQKKEKKKKRKEKEERKKNMCAQYTVPPLVRRMGAGTLTEEQMQDAASVLKTLTDNPSMLRHFVEADGVPVATKVIMESKYRRQQDVLAKMMLVLARAVAVGYGEFADVLMLLPNPEEAEEIDSTGDGAKLFLDFICAYLDSKHPRATMDMKEAALCILLGASVRPEHRETIALCGCLDYLMPMLKEAEPGSTIEVVICALLWFLAAEPANRLALTRLGAPTLATAILEREMVNVAEQFVASEPQADRFDLQEFAALNSKRCAYSYSRHGSAESCAGFLWHISLNACARSAVTACGGARALAIYAEGSLFDEAMSPEDMRKRWDRPESRGIQKFIMHPSSASDEKPKAKGAVKMKPKLKLKSSQKGGFSATEFAAQAAALRDLRI